MVHASVIFHAMLHKNNGKNCGCKKKLNFHSAECNSFAP